jgi:NAD+ synthase (glutamine-hydrolysing)
MHSSNNIRINDTEQVYKALILGLKDYFTKNGFKKAIIGLSGGIDSALTATLAVEALGKENVLGITMPSMYSSTGSIDDSKVLAKNLGIMIKTVPIKPIYDSYISTLHEGFSGTKENIAEENIQARIRGNILMAFSNKFGYLVLSTGNKSELAVGYCTLYGDMSGGLAVIADVPKTMVYDIAKYYNSIKGYDIIPRNTLEKPPSAELRPDQKDSDSLPEYDILDVIIDYYVEKDYSKDQIISKGFDAAIVEKVIKLIKINEYKRYQAALGFKVTSKAFGSGRRMPITNRWGQ